MKVDDALEQMAQRAKKGDEDSFVALCDAMKTPLYRAAKGILGDESLALEAVSEAVTRAYSGIGRLKQPQFASTWFTRILINAAKDISRRQSHERQLETLDLQAPYYDRHEKLDFQQMISSLNPELREIVSLKYYSEYTLEEISRVLKLPTGTVKSRLNRALKQLRVEVEK